MYMKTLQDTSINNSVPFKNIAKIAGKVTLFQVKNILEWDSGILMNNKCFQIFNVYKLTKILWWSRKWIRDVHVSVCNYNITPALYILYGCRCGRKQVCKYFFHLARPGGCDHYNVQLQKIKQPVNYVSKQRT